MDKKKLSETDIRTKFITPAIVKAGWDLHTQIREEVALTEGRVVVKGKHHSRGPAKFADYVLYYKPNALPVTQGVALKVRSDFRTRLEKLTCWDGSPLGTDLKAELAREYACLELVELQLRTLEA